MPKQPIVSFTGAPIGAIDILLRYLQDDYPDAVLMHGTDDGDPFYCFYTPASDDLCLRIQQQPSGRWIVVDYTRLMQGEFIAAGASAERCAWALGANLRLGRQITPLPKPRKRGKPKRASVVSLSRVVGL